MQALKDIVCANGKDDAAKQGIYKTYLEALEKINQEDVAKQATDRGRRNVDLYRSMSEKNDESLHAQLDKLVEDERLLQNIEDTVTRCNGDDHRTLAAHTELQGTLFEGLDRRLINHPSLLGQGCLPLWTWAGRKLWVTDAKGVRHEGSIGIDTEKVQRDNVIGVIAGYDKECANYICDEIERLAAQTQETYDGQKQKRHVYFVFNTQGGDVAALQQILVCMDRYRDRLLYVGIIAAPECAAAMAASCGGCHFAACDICILEGLSQFLMHEVSN